MNKKTNEGITLIALVITIIVLLILAAVSLNLVAGGDGILGKATTAVDSTKIAAAQEQAELLMAELKTDYYEARYVNRTTTDTVGGYIESQIGDGKATNDCFVTVANGAITVYAGNSAVAGNKIMTGTLTSDGKVAWGSENAGGTTPSEPSIPEVATKYTVTYNANGGTGSVPASAEYIEGATVTVDFSTIPTKEGFEFLGWAKAADATEATYTSAGTTSFTMGTANVTLYAVWGGTTFANLTAANYGEYVDLGTSLIVNDNIALADGTIPETDWRIFYEDADGGIYLILADYLPYDATLGTGLLNNGDGYPYNWKSGTSRSDLINRLNNTSAWNKLIDSTYTAKGISVKGAIDLETWVESWNAKGYTELFINTYSNQNNGLKMSDELDGYYVGTEENPETTSINMSLTTNTGYGNALYFPHKNNTTRSKVAGYWLASPAVGNVNDMMLVGYYGGVDFGGYANVSYGVRPTVYLPTGILANKNVEGIWQLDI